ncbi:MAG: cysteine--tRNA ligase, partial [Thiovulaceae bacterium]|nr:cysteine--tRNA ligase [Sulfurimonadaceae bacterium]
EKLIKRQTLADLAFIEKVLGFGTKNPFEYFQFGLDEETKAKIDALVEARAEAKKAKDFAKSDALRDEIMAYGVSIMDTAQGTFWERAE